MNYYIPLLFVLHPILSPHSAWSVHEIFTDKVMTHITIYYIIQDK